MKQSPVYGWVPDRPDHRDYLYSAIAPKIKLPSRVDLRSEDSPIENQGRLGSCTANALAGNLQFLEEINGKSYKDLSRLFIYYNERSIEGTVGYDSGAMIRDGIKSLAKYGVCPESAWPYDISQFTRKPATACYKEALKRRIVSYHRLATLSEMLNCLADGFPFVFGFSVYESFESPKVAQTGIVPMPKRSEKVLGGHAVMAAGYDQKQKRFIVRNSWGTQWGQAGYFTMPYAYLETLADDFWTIRQ
ncbi:MAG: C1 family peptidase [Candidatus Omnitrophica bacterium]|nr:C1 family peptidase [Candidatus Omnitrophota bacterium]MDE2213484.1 C1 family peptidase [Candidatus Omnitrophota bacterium]MDE2230615.1 C1 family peptidase [Candidatus Omnitrophota bacterium]